MNAGIPDVSIVSPLKNNKMKNYADSVRYLLQQGMRFRRRPANRRDIIASLPGKDNEKPAYMIHTKDRFDLAMKYMESKGKVCCNGMPASVLPYEPRFKFLIVGERDFQLWSDRDALIKAGYVAWPITDLIK